MTTDDTGPTWGRAWAWVPTLYFVQGLPYTIVNVVSVPLFKSLGVSNAAIAFATSGLGLVWAIKALWSPFVDGVSTKRRWTLAMQAAFALPLLALAASVSHPSFFGIGVALLLVLAVLSATHDIAADGLYLLGLDEARQAAFVGVRSTFWRLALIAGEGGLVAAAGVLAARFGSVSRGWSLTLLGTAALFLLLAAYDAWALPRPAGDVPRRTAEAGGNALEAVRTFFTKPGIGRGLLFILLYRFAENHMARLITPFLLDERAAGGLGLSLEQVGFAKGTVGVGCLVLGGVLGGVAIYRHGLEAWLWPMAVALNVPNAVYVYLAWARPDALPLVSALLGLESFGYGFGFAAYTMVLIRLADGPYRTAHYAFATGLMALAAWLAQFWSGAMQEWLGYPAFFLWVLALTVPGFAVVALVDVPPGFGRRRA